MRYGKNVFAEIEALKKAQAEAKKKTPEATVKVEASKVAVAPEVTVTPKATSKPIVPIDAKLPAAKPIVAEPSKISPNAELQKKAEEKIQQLVQPIKTAIEKAAPTESKVPVIVHNEAPRESMLKKIAIAVVVILVAGFLVKRFKVKL